MKKLLMLIVFTLLFVPSIIFADMGAPGILEYKAIITAEGGAIIYEDPEDGGKATSEKIKKNEVVTVTFEESGYALTEHGYLKLSDITPVEKELKFNSNDWGRKTNGVVLQKTDLKKGPADGYEKAGELNPGDTITIYLSKEGDGESSWVYVEGKGYANTYHGTIAFTPRTEELIAVYDISIGNENLKCGTKFTAKIFNLDAWSSSYYIQYNGSKGVVSNADVEPKSGEITVTAEKDFNIYESLLPINENADEEKDFKKIGTLKKGETFKTNFVSEDNYYQRIYYDNGNIKGWIYVVDASSPEAGIKVDYPDDWFEDEEIVEEKVETVDVPTEPIEVKIPENANQTEPTSSQPVTTTGTVEKKVPDNLYIYIGFALCICVTAVVTTLLVNKKNKAKENNNEKK